MSYHPPDSSLGSSNTPQTMPIVMTSANTQATAMEDPGVERFRAGDEMQSLPTPMSADYPALFSAGESDARTQDTQNEWMPGFGKMDPQTRRDALNRYLQTPKITFEGIVRPFLLQQQQQQQSQHEAQRKAAEKEAMEREMRMRTEQQRQLPRLDGQGFQARRF